MASAKLTATWPDLGTTTSTDGLFPSRSRSANARKSTRTIRGVIPCAKEADLPIAGTKFSLFTSSAKKPSPASAAFAASPPASERPDA